MSVIKRIRLKLEKRDYFLSAHAEEEMMDDQLKRGDLENAINKGRVRRKLTRDFEGPDI